MNSQYIVDIIDIEWDVTTTNNCDMNWKLSQPTRGVLAMSGFIDFKENINTHKAIGKLDVYYSANAITYMLTPYRMPDATLTDYINIYYKDFFMDSALECCENPINFQDQFTSPLTKRRIICENCVIRADNFPTHMRLGFYRYLITFVGELGFKMIITVKLEEE
ncbi:uncharacterized protein ACRADG_001560 [Cochliomyia hominivorax]